MTNTPDGDDLRRFIAHADPSVSLTPLRGDQITRLTENTMAHNTSTTTNPSPTRLSRRAWLLGGSGVGVAAIAAAVFIGSAAVGPATSATMLTQPPSGGPAAMCAELTPDALTSYDTAFRAKVTTIEKNMVTLTVSDTFKGEVSNTVTAPQGDGAVVDGAPLVFNEGGTYLISTRDGMIVTCGASGEESPALDSIYQRAFTQ